MHKAQSNGTRKPSHNQINIQKISPPKQRESMVDNQFQKDRYKLENEMTQVTEKN